MKYPEHDKLHAVHEKSQAVGSFMEWLRGEKGVELMTRYSREGDECGEPVYRNSDGKVVEDWPPSQSGGAYEPNYKEREKREQEEGIERRLVADPHGEHLCPFAVSDEKLLAEFFEIDLNKLEAEKRAMLEECRRNNGG